MIEIKSFNPEDAVNILQDQSVLQKAKFNQNTGPGYTAFRDGKPIASGGVRMYGVGEAWGIFSDEALKHKFIPEMPRWDLFHDCREWLDRIIKENNLWRLYAEPTIPDKAHKLFLERLDFEEKQLFIRKG